MSALAPPSASTVSHNALPVGQRLDEFEIRAVIGEGGFGIVYHAFDHALERDVAIKEYMPAAMAARDATLQVSVLSQSHVETFALGLRSFVNEARLLARFDHPSLVKVHRFWEAHGTAYMVMPYYRGRTLKAKRQGLGASPSEHWLRGLLEPLLGALEALHREDVYHRDISPDNIVIGDDGRPVLLDFGAARRVIGDQSQALTAILKPNFAPIEQYAETEGLRQGPWTDLYALGATLHFAIVGKPPQPATARAMGSEMALLSTQSHRGVSVDFLRMVDWMMAPRPEHRPQNVAALRAVLGDQAAAPKPAPAPPAPAPSPTSWEHTVAQDSVFEPPSSDLAKWDMTSARSEPGQGAHLRTRPSRRNAWLGLGALCVAGGAAAWMFSVQAPAPAALSPVVAASPATTPPVTATPAASAVAATPAPATVVASPAPAQTDLAVSPIVAAAPPPDAKPDEPKTPAPHKPKHAAKPVEPVARESTMSFAAVEPTAAAPASSPSEQCRGRVLLAWYRCVKRACQASPEYSNAHECQRVRQIEADNARRRSSSQ